MVSVIALRNYKRCSLSVPHYSKLRQRMSASGHKHPAPQINVRLPPKADIALHRSECPLCAKSRLMHCSRSRQPLLQVSVSTTWAASRTGPTVVAKSKNERLRKTFDPITATADRARREAHRRLD